MKKGQSMSMNVIVVAILVLLTLAVMVLIFTGRIRIFADGSRSCETQKGVCRVSCGNGETSVYGTNCEDSSQRCCVEVFKTT